MRGKLAIDSARASAWWSAGERGVQVEEDVEEVAEGVTVRAESSGAAEVL